MDLLIGAVMLAVIVAIGGFVLNVMFLVFVAGFAACASIIEKIKYYFCKKVE